MIDYVIKLYNILQTVNMKDISTFSNKYFTFAIIKLNTGDTLPYYITTASIRDFNIRIDNLKTVYPS